ncbi:MAG TPA: flagellar basal-body MS-ring/collar protein FliF [Paucimonas sp.]|nr:flagellar basal-body MS-ring/collar protein FliF [Paucimonas sp.]
MMKTIPEIWQRLNQRAKAGVAAGGVAIVMLAIGIGWWAYRSDYQVLFAEVAPRDAAAMTAELDRMKIPYQLADGGNTILVPQEAVYKTRLKLMGTDLPLHGAVGFEVFNNADFGMTDFVQKVNYQRAVQGELTRTIQSIEDIQAVRVHLAMPEQGLFKKTNARPKASITLTMMRGRTLAPEQILGIQRLVAASVPDMAAADVTVLDQHGVALTRVASADGSVDTGNAQLDAKRGAEDYLQRKVMQVLERTFGPGEAIASVDVVLNLDQSRVTTEDVLPSKAGPQDGSPTGVVVRERQTLRDPAAGGAANKDAQNSTVTNIESDYQVGRRVEHVVSTPGGIRRLTIAVVVKKALDDAQVERLKEVVGLAAGLDGQRGDAIVVQSMQKFAEPGSDASTVAHAAAEQTSTADAPIAGLPAAKQSGSRFDAEELLSPMTSWMPLAALAVIVIALAAVRQRRQTPAYAAEKPRLSEAERALLLSNVKQWIDGGRPADAVQGQKK